MILTGAAGGRKTLLAMAAALEQTIERKHFDKINPKPPDIPANPLVFFPEPRKRRCYCGPTAVTDTLRALHKNDHCTEGSMKYICGKPISKFKSINFMRGRSDQMNAVSEPHRFANQNHHYSLW
ncbi:hypothetical protein O9929_01780 [Vibrio lentus]|nr:hypothetical protein [Vibrio lentus]